ncbi:hypothetical protein DEJ55_04665 [Bacillus pumilus]|nr:hypothetical protein [Bacillus pumilus]RAU07271.1 hypothetical protein DEJ55_04665 [Bacillus pumilus]
MIVQDGQVIQVAEDRKKFS